jgi:hypothetical protein
MKTFLRVTSCLWILALGTTLTISPALAFFSPASVSVVPPVQFPPSDFSITGVRASALWGQHRDVYGLDLGLLGNVTEQDFVGLAVSGIFNYTQGTTSAIGLQLAGAVNINTNKTTVVGAQIAGLYNDNRADSSVAGLQLALANFAPHTEVWGFQAGLYNKARAVRGVQIGIVNVADSLTGVQIGLVNFLKNGLFAVSPIINIGF